MNLFLEMVQDDSLFALWRLYCVTGCRRGEALAATWDSLDLDSGGWEINRSLGVVNGQRHLAPQDRNRTPNHSLLGRPRDHRRSVSPQSPPGGGETRPP